MIEASSRTLGAEEVALPSRIELPAEVIGSHGTSRGAVPHLLAGEIESSDQHFEWLGTGFYIWQESPWRAQQWAVEQFGEDAAVIVASVSLDGCLDLLNPYWQRELADADDQYMAECLAEDRPPVQNRPGGNRARDCAVINWYCDSVAREGLQIRSHPCSSMAAARSTRSAPSSAVSR